MCEPRCVADAEVTPAVRCCADGAETTCSTAGVVEPPPPAPLADGQCTSRASCAELKADYGGWPVKTVRVDGFTGWRVCGESDNGLGDDSSNECRGGSAVGVEDGHTRTVANTDVSGWAHATSICLGAGATTGFAVKGGGYYVVKGTTLVDDPHPEGAVSEEGSFLDALEKAGRESTGGK